MVNKEVLVDGSEAGWAGEKSNDSVIFYINLMKKIRQINMLKKNI